jgi:NTP pyrophosphatase (non-canonical NTP hydrolase)
MTDDLKDLRERQEDFIQERNWEQFHTPKSIAMALSVEANELTELFQWHDNLPADAYTDHPDIHDAVEDELADILIYTLSMATQFNVNLADAATHKLEKNAERYDPETAATISDELSQWQRSE